MQRIITKNEGIRSIKALRRMTISQAYFILLVSIALLVTGTHFMTSRIISVNKDFAAVINISGRQRMLSQRIMLFAHELAEDKSKENRNILRKSAEEFAKNHNDLINGNPERGLPPLHNARVHNIYFGEQKLDHDARAYAEAAETFSKAPSSELLHNNLMEMQEVFQDDLLRKLDEVVHEHQREAEEVLRLTLLYGTVLWLITLLVLVMEARFLFYPLTRRVENEIALRRRAEKELLRSNSELEDFAYVASHDLKAPLRHISSCADIINKEFSDDLSDEAKGYFGHIRDESKHMRLLIDSLLEFSRVGQQNNALDEMVDLAKIADRVIRRMAQMDSKPASVIYENLPVVKGSPILLERLFENLIGNAVKYVSEDTVPEIRITSEITPTHAIVSFADNGIGIAPEYSDKIFRIFQRLHGKNSAYQGVGLGLAIVKRITEIHGGAVELDTEYVGGSRFLVTLPLA